MIMGKMGRFASGGLLFAVALGVTACGEKKHWSSENAETENASDTRPVTPPQPTPATDAPTAPPTPVATEKPVIPPAEPPSAEAQMQDDADASGMTAPVQSGDDTSGPASNEN
ncbi:hypothetical protein [Sphingomonas sp.]|uniref:hypothetical protein n=1 Tax=Sphingomonas sp. TaxID=28214 RepID=UPI003B3A1C21